MEYRQLGNTGLAVSALGFGASPIGDAFGPIDPSEGQRAVDAAIDQGINYFDTSPYYGNTLSESRLGSFLKPNRQRVILATKAGRYGKDLPDGFDFSAARIQRSVEESLRRLQTDVIDVFQVHDIEFGDLNLIVEETLPAMMRLKEQGKVRFIGITGYPLKELKYVVERATVDTVLSYCHYDLLNTRLVDELLDVVQARGIGLINASPLHMGVLTDEGAPEWHPAPPEVHRRAGEAAAWARRNQVDLSVIALQFALSQPAIATTLVGMSTQREVERNVECVGNAPDPQILSTVMDFLNPAVNISWPSGIRG